MKWTFYVWHFKTHILGPKSGQCVWGVVVVGIL